MTPRTRAGRRLLEDVPGDRGLRDAVLAIEAEMRVQIGRALDAQQAEAAVSEWCEVCGMWVGHIFPHAPASPKARPDRRGGVRSVGGPSGMREHPSPPPSGGGSAVIPPDDPTEAQSPGPRSVAQALPGDAD